LSRQACDNAGTECLENADTGARRRKFQVSWIIAGLVRRRQETGREDAGGTGHVHMLDSCSRLELQRRCRLQFLENKAGNGLGLGGQQQFTGLPVATKITIANLQTQSRGQLTYAGCHGPK